MASTTGHDQIVRVEGSDNGKTVTVVFSEPFTDWKSLFSGLLPARYMATIPLFAKPTCLAVRNTFANVGATPPRRARSGTRACGPEGDLTGLVTGMLPGETLSPRWG